MHQGDDNRETANLSHVGLRPYFAESVEAAIRNQGVQTMGLAREYLIDLLIDFARAEVLFREGPEADEPLALMVQRARSVPRAERIHVFRQMGDHALFLSGYFGDRVSRRTVGVGYYISMGEGAYASVSDLVRDLSENGNLASALFSELAEKFAKFVDVLAEVSDRAAARNPMSVLKLYERWMQTRSPEIARRLLVEEAAPIHLGPSHRG